MTVSRRPEDYPLHTHDKLRYADVDRQGHVNNAVFASLFETGRVELIYAYGTQLREPGSAFVIARLAIDFLGEVHWPGTIDIGTRVAAFGRSSISFEQALFQEGRCVATAQSAIVNIDERTRRSRALSEEVVGRLEALRDMRSCEMSS